MEKIKCNNASDNDDCKFVKDKYKTCSVCKAVWKKVIVITHDGDNPHVPQMYKDALTDIHGRTWDRFQHVYANIKLELIDSYVVVDYENDFTWTFKFKASEM